MSRHPDFKTVEASRPDWNTSAGFRYTKTADPSWAPGDGANSLDASEAAAAAKHVAIDPYEPGRPPTFNYKLLISAITPRPIGFVSTRSGPRAGAGGEKEGEGEETFNLAPFSYFNVVSTDPPMFSLGISSPLARPKDTLRHLVANGECTVNIISEHFIEAANATSIDAPAGCSEWVVSGLTPVHDCAAVAAPRAREAVFSVECRVDSIREFESRAAPGRKSGCMVLLEGLRFWVREDALNDERNAVAADILRPMSRLGGISYGRTVEAIELPRPVFEKDLGIDEYEKLKKKQAAAAAAAATTTTASTNGTAE
ncbi:FMN-binding split barrel [Xylaria palmicola]|nr:FMN-binding split barrel [Xylaria palmicola]